MSSWNYGLALVPDLADQRLGCSHPHCATPPGYYARYDYTTGRRGRVTTASRYYCAAHAEAFAIHHALPWPPPALSYLQTQRTSGRELLAQ